MFGENNANTKLITKSFIIKKNKSGIILSKWKIYKRKKIHTMIIDNGAISKINDVFITLYGQTLVSSWNILKEHN